MNHSGNTWSLILAAGEGSRLRSLTTTDAGISIPKQFCSLHGGASLFQQALQRGETISSPRHVCAVVAAQHRVWWQGLSSRLPAANLIAQPRNLGTAIGILLPLLQILERDPGARMVLLPADHHVEDESVLAESIRHAVARLASHPDDVVLLGIEPEEPDPELGYILPQQGEQHSGLKIDRFIEKPDRKTASYLLDQGALWNAFIIVARAQALLKMFIQRYPDIVAEMLSVISAQRHAAQAAMNLIDLYQRLPELDFSRHILEGQESHLRVVAVPHCGWTDLGTPKRVGEALRRLERPFRDETMSACLNLAAQHERLMLREKVVA